MVLVQAQSGACNVVMFAVSARIHLISRQSTLHNAKKFHGVHGFGMYLDDSTTIQSILNQVGRGCISTDQDYFDARVFALQLLGEIDAIHSIQRNVRHEKIGKLLYDPYESALRVEEHSGFVASKLKDEHKSPSNQLFVIHHVDAAAYLLPVGLFQIVASVLLLVHFAMYFCRRAISDLCSARTTFRATVFGNLVVAKKASSC